MRVHVCLRMHACACMFVYACVCIMTSNIFSPFTATFIFNETNGDPFCPCLVMNTKSCMNGKKQPLPTEQEFIT